MEEHAQQTTNPGSPTPFVIAVASVFAAVSVAALLLTIWIASPENSFAKFFGLSDEAPPTDAPIMNKVEILADLKDDSVTARMPEEDKRSTIENLSTASEPAATPRGGATVSYEEKMRILKSLQQ